MVFYIKIVEIESKVMKIGLFFMALCLCVFASCEKDEPVLPPTEQPEEPETPVEPEEPQEPIPTDGIINWNNEFIIVGDNNMANIGSGTWYSVCYGNGKYVAVGSNSSAAYSTDGISWNKTTAGSGLLYSVCYGNEKYVAVGNGNSVAYSSDGVNWVTKAVTGIGMDGICYGNGKFVAVGSIGRVAYSSDGVS